MMPAYWDVENGVFAPFHLKPNGFSEELLQLISPVAFPEDATLYFRGSLLEEENPHPAADLDLALVSQGLRANGELVREIVESVSALGKQVDLSVMSLDQLKCSLPMRLLLHTRAVKLHGQEYSLEPVPATMETVAAHLTAYAPSFPPDVFVASVRSRVSALKNLTRCFGCFSTSVQSNPSAQSFAYFHAIYTVQSVVSPSMSPPVKMLPTRIAPFTNR